MEQQTNDDIEVSTPQLEKCIQYLKTVTLDDFLKEKPKDMPLKIWKKETKKSQRNSTEYMFNIYAMTLISLNEKEKENDIIQSYYLKIDDLYEKIVDSLKPKYHSISLICEMIYTHGEYGNYTKLNNYFILFLRSMEEAISLGDKSVIRYYWMNCIELYVVFAANPDLFEFFGKTNKEVYQDIEKFLNLVTTGT